MTFKLTHPLPEKCLVAVSGGVDSMVALHWLDKVPGRVAGVVHLNHNTGLFADRAESKVRGTVADLGIPFRGRKLHRGVEEGHSPENWWREQRYRWFKEVSAAQGNLPVVLAHHLDDCLEEYVLCTMVRGYQGTIPYRHGPCIRPFRLWKKKDILAYAQRERVDFLEDPTNKDTRFKRNLVRHRLTPELLELNPGLHKIVERLIWAQDRANGIV